MRGAAQKCSGLRAASVLEKTLRFGIRAVSVFGGFYPGAVEKIAQPIVIGTPRLCHSLVRHCRQWVFVNASQPAGQRAVLEDGLSGFPVIRGQGQKRVYVGHAGREAGKSDTRRV